MYPPLQIPIFGSIAEEGDYRQENQILSQSVQSTMDEDLKRIVKFNAKHAEDYNLWSMRFEALLESKVLLEVVLRDTSVELTATEMTSELNLRMAKARSLLVHSLGDKLLRTVLSEKKDPAKMYEKLNERYAAKSSATRVQLQTELHYMKYSEEKSMSEYIDGMESLLNRLESMDCSLPASMQVAILLASFGNTETSPHGPVVSALQTLSDSDLTWENATARLLQEYESREAFNPGNKPTVEERPEKALSSRSNITCYHCGKKGRIKRQCRLLIGNKRQPRYGKRQYGKGLGWNKPSLKLRFDIEEEEERAMSAGAMLELTVKNKKLLEKTRRLSSWWTQVRVSI